MSGIQLGNITPVQAPNYNAAIQAYSNAAATDQSGAKGFMQGLQMGSTIANQNRAQSNDTARLAIAQQTADQAKQLNAMKIMQDQKTMMANTAFGITQLPEDKQKDAYNNAVMGMAQQGIIKPQEVLNWDKGGSDLVKQIAVQSPLYVKSIKSQLDMQKSAADLDLIKARTESYDIKNKQSASGIGAAGKPLSSDAAKVYEIANSGLAQVDQLKDVYGKVENPGLADKLPAFLQSDNAQKLSFLKNDLSDRIGRLRSGGAINADEVAKFNKLLPSMGDSTETVNSKLDQLSSSFTSVTQAIRPNGPVGAQSPVVDNFAKYQQQYPGLTKEQYEAAIKK